jgi:anti-sigma-K factor RskA
VSREADIVSYLLGEMAPGERRALEQRASRDPAFRDEVDRMRAVVADLEAMPALGWGAAEPPPLPDLPPLADLGRPARRRTFIIRPMVAVAASVAVLAAGIGIGALVTGGGGGGAEGPAFALQALGEAGAQASGEARVVDDGGEGLRLRVDGMEPSQTGEFYELWLLDGPDRLVSLGSFRVPDSGEVEVDVPLPVPVGDFAFIDVSVEREDGDPGHSGRSVLRGPTTST